jgi:hypothetical protein
MRHVAWFIRVQDNKCSIDPVFFPQLRCKSDGVIANPAPRGLKLRNDLNNPAISGHFHSEL